ncbi:hypothetical protein [Spongiibacter tropicus]|uniref:hypothetical protein n=1 Tax=Spongiibacter tropicus TaxID=454602 RepID=UPI0003B54D3E|nr:hypothetical protein [Spongiibacter tropicus]
MNARVLALIILIPLSLPASADELATLERISTWVRELFPLSFPTSEQQLAAFGDLTSKTVSSHTIDGGGNPGHYVEWVLDGIVLRAFVAESAAPNIYVYAIELTSSSWPLSNGIAVDMSSSVLVQLPFAANDGDYGYCGVAETCVHFIVEDGFIAAIRFQFYIG